MYKELMNLVKLWFYGISKRDLAEFHTRSAGKEPCGIVAWSLLPGIPHLLCRAHTFGRTI